MGLPARPAAAVKDDRAGIVCRQLALDLPQHGFAAIGGGLPRLPLDQLIDFAVAITAPVQARAAAVEHMENGVGVGPAGLQVESDAVVATQDLGIILRGLDQLEFAVDIDLL